jgi:adenylosuccinate synthase
MSNIAVLGAMWGDEGKGHITHFLSRQFDWVIRFNGGANAGHTIYRDGKKFVHNLLPSVDFRHPHIKAFLGAGMVIDPGQLLKEVLEAEKEYPGVTKRIYVDPDAFVVLPEHKETDRKTNAHIGSTNRGIGPAYVDKVGRRGTRIRDLLNLKGAQNHIAANMDVDTLVHIGVNFKHVLELDQEFADSNKLFEGAQGVLLDINHGIYPYVSCSDCTIGGIYASGFSDVKLDHVYGVAKCYTTKVGEGPFPSELHGAEAEELRKLGNEYGATTGRPRRVGWLDLPALRYACRKGGINRLIITKMDILAGRDVVPVVHAYEKEPVCPDDFNHAVPSQMDLLGWDDCKDHDQMARFIKEVEYGAGCYVSYISCGTSESDIVPWDD